MRKTKLSARESFMVGLLIVILIGVAYYLGFYTPLKNEMASIEAQRIETETSITANMAKVASMDDMQAELDEILNNTPKDQLTEIAPYDNKEVVLTQLYGILTRTKDYSLDFTDPEVQEDGTVRRNISMKFTCGSYDAAKAVIRDLTDSRWRCLVSNLSLASENNLMRESVDVTATITFFEHTDLA